MLFHLRTARTACTAIARISVVALLWLALLAGLFPAGTLSASHLCKMACCAAKPPHEAGACNAVLPRAEQADEATAEEATPDEHASHQDEMQMASAAHSATVEIHDSSDHCRTAKHSPAQTEAPRPPAPTQQEGRAVVQAFTKPCSEECAAAACAPVQLRRPRETAAALTIALKPRPPTSISRSSLASSLLPSNAARRRSSRPRAPPVSPVNHSA